MNSHRDLILDQFTRQAIPFATAPSIRSQESLDRIVRLSEAGPRDVVLDVACGPGLLVCTFAKVVAHATGIDITPAMLEQARREQERQAIANVTWQCGDVLPLPYADESFSIVTARFAFHHFPDPPSVLLEMRRVCKTGGCVLVADSAPQREKADAFNRIERLRDPSHVRAMPPEELAAMFRQVGFEVTRTDSYRLEGELEEFLGRSFPGEGDADRIRRMFADSLDGDGMDLAVRLLDGKLYFGFPVAILAAQK